MKTRVRIFKPAKSAMQSGRGGKMDHWYLEGCELSSRTPEHLMGWVSAEDTNDQIQMVFDCKNAAVEFAESKGWAYEIHDPSERKVKPQNYMDNFPFHPIVYHPAEISTETEKKKAAKPERSKASGTRVKKSDTAGREKAKKAKPKTAKKKTASKKTSSQKKS